MVITQELKEFPVLSARGRATVAENQVRLAQLQYVSTQIKVKSSQK